MCAKWVYLHTVAMVGYGFAYPTLQKLYSVRQRTLSDTFGIIHLVIPVFTLQGYSDLLSAEAPAKSYAGMTVAGDKKAAEAAFLSPRLLIPARTYYAYTQTPINQIYQ